MQSSFSIVSVLYLLGAAQGAFLALALYSHRGGNRLANRYLGLLTLVFVLALVDYFLDTTGLRQQHVWLRTLLWPKEFLYGTLIYFYVRELTLPDRFSLRGSQWLHFLPFLLHVLATWPLLFLSEARQLFILTDKVSTGFDGFMALLLGDVELYVTIGQITLYLYLSLRLIQAHNLRIRQTFSDIEKINLRWLSRLLFGIFIVYLIWLVEELLSHWIQQESLWDALLGISMVVLIYSMGYLGLRQPLIFSHLSRAETTEILAQPPAPELTDDNADSRVNKYKNSPLSPELSQAFLEELQTHMATEKPYLDNQLSLPELAQQLNISLNYLSQIINQQTGKNFFDFINGYRIADAKARLSTNGTKNLNILSLAMDVGFNSKSAFYNAFRKHTGMTPTQFRSQLKVDSQAA